MLDLKEEQKYEELRKLAQELHIPIPEAFLELEVTDKDGKVIQRHKQRSHSWTRNAYNLMFSQLAGKNGNDGTFGAGLLSGKNTGGVILAIPYPLAIVLSDASADVAPNGYMAGSGVDTRGIMVGSGINAESFEDFALQTKITNGVAAGQLSYVASAAHVISYDALSKVLKNTLIRYFNNNSGGDVSVNEVAIVSYGWGATTVLMARDKLALTVTIPNTGQLKVTYTVQLTFPS